MPNWCENKLKMTGPKDLIVALYERAVSLSETTNEGLLEAMRPMPEALKETTAPRDKPNWYDWAIDHWGTKWDVETNDLHLSVDEVEGKATIVGFFDSAWSPPLEALVWYGEQHPDVEIELGFLEGGLGFAGVLTISDGEAEEKPLEIGNYARVEDVPAALLDQIPMLEAYFQMLDEMAEEE